MLETFDSIVNNAFWCVGFLFFLVIALWAEAEEKGWWLFLSTAASLMVLDIASTIDLVAFFTQTPPQRILLYVIAYLAIGVVWSFFAWYRFLAKIKALYLEILPKLKENWKNSLYREKMGEGEETYIQAQINLHFLGDYGGFPPPIARNKARISRWILAFPVSMLAFVCADFLVDLGVRIVDFFKGIYQTITNKMLGDLPK